MTKKMRRKMLCWNLDKRKAEIRFVLCVCSEMFCPVITAAGESFKHCAELDGSEVI